MIQAHWSYRAGHRFTKKGVALKKPPRLGPKFYSAFAGATSRHEVVTNLLTRPQEPCKLCPWRPRRLNCVVLPRFASTSSIPSTADVRPDHAPAPQYITPTEEEFLPTSLDGVTSSISPPVYEHLGFLKEMGLDYGWGPTAFVEYVLEHVHIYLGTPWWASIGISMVLLRSLLFKFYMDAADISARRQLLKPLEDPIRERINATKTTQDKRALLQASQELSLLHRSSGVKIWKSFIPFLQLPVGFGTFRLMRGMASLPVPGFDTGGLLWMPDLTQPDPYFILPIATAATYHYTFKNGGETGASVLASDKVRILFLYVVPPVSGLFMIFWPGGLQLTFFISALIGAIQAMAIKSNFLRSLMGIQPLPEPPVPGPQIQTRPQNQAPSSTASDPKVSKGMFGYIKGTVSELQKAGEKFTGVSRQQAEKDRLTPAEKRYAMGYEAKRNRELEREAEMKRQSAQARFESRQEQEAREQETKEEETRERDRKEKLRARAARKAKKRQ